ncbi:MAG: MarR family winged helix-turn-helix transcriptional regulator [Roseobacter sp.]
MPDQKHATLFELFNEIGIIEQLSRASLEARLPDGLIAPHFTVLNHLVRLGDGKAPIDIARAFQVPKTTLTHTLKGLESHGLIQMRPNPEDGRSKLVYLTDAGRALRQDTISAMAPDFDRLIEGVDVDMLADVVPTLRALRVFLDDDKNRAPGPLG